MQTKYSGCNPLLRIVLLSSLIPAFSLPVNAQSIQPSAIPSGDPNRDRFPQSTPPIQSDPKVPILIPPPKSETPTSGESNTMISVKSVKLLGSTILSESDVRSIVQKYEGRSVSFTDLQKLADDITQLYISRGYITSRAILIPQSITDGMVQIQAEEGSIEKIELEGIQRIKPSYVRSRLELGITKPFRLNPLEEQLQLLKTDPLFSTVEASLRLGSQEGTSVLQVRIKEANPFTGSINIDNYSPSTVGSERFSVGLGYRNLTGNADELNGSYQRSFTGGLSALDFNYRIPINPMNGTIQLRTAANWSNVTDDRFKSLGLKGNSNLYEISYRQPLIRNLREEFALSAGFAYQQGQTFIFNDFPTPFGFGPDVNGNSKTRVLKIGQDYTKRDTKGILSLRSQFNLGLGIFDATNNAEPVPDGQFFSWLGSVQRVQQLNSSNQLIIQADLQLTPNSLLPSQQFVIGGGQSLRGYRQNARSGDNGFRASVENRIAVARNATGSPIFQIAPFVDFGQVWNNSNNPNPLPKQNFLAAGGVGLIWEPIPQMIVRLDGSIPFVNIDDRGNNLQDKSLYFSLGYRF